jgi:hypothetical protein
MRTDMTKLKVALHSFANASKEKRCVRMKLITIIIAIVIIIIIIIVIDCNLVGLPVSLEKQMFIRRFVRSGSREEQHLQLGREQF